MQGSSGSNGDCGTARIEGHEDPQFARPPQIARCKADLTQNRLTKTFLQLMMLHLHSTNLGGVRRPVTGSCPNPHIASLVQVSDRGKWMRNMLRAPDAHIYICGDSLMANAVTASLTQVIGKNGRISRFASRHLSHSL